MGLLPIKRYSILRSQDRLQITKKRPEMSAWLQVFKLGVYKNQVRLISGIGDKPTMM
jgi:hypothetical protein